MTKYLTSAEVATMGSVCRQAIIKRAAVLGMRPAQVTGKGRIWLWTPTQARQLAKGLKGRGK